MESSAGHAVPSYVVLHELFPNETSSRVFRHQHRDAHINPDHILAVPVCQRIERVDESVPMPSTLFVLFTDVSEHPHGFLGEKRQRPARRTRNDAAVNASHGRRTAPNGIAARRRSEEHTSELQSPDHLVCRLLLEKKKTTLINT